MACGNELGKTGRASQQAVGHPEERRLVTVLFADVSGYTAVAERLDHEAVKRLMDRCLTRLAREVDRFGGRVDKFIGDNVMAVFGAPVAHEDDPLRALRAAMAMQAAMAELNQSVSAEFGFELGLRVGVNTGEVLAGQMGDAYTVVGDTVNVASRLQTAAPVGGVLVGERTHASTADWVAFRALEPLSLKGKAQPVAAWEAVGFQASVPDQRSRSTQRPFVGRGDELGQLDRHLRLAVRDRETHIVTVTGHPGVGKTRLLREFERQLEGADLPVSVHRGRCPAFGSTGVYWPVSEMLRAECAIADDDDSAVAWEKLSARLGPLITRLEGAQETARRLAPLARLVGAESPEESPATEQEGEQAAREAFFGTVRTVFEALAGEQPLVLAWEDIHWADEGTLDLIEYLSLWLRAPVLQVCAAREELLERRTGWSSPRRSASVIFLEPLAPDETRELIESVLRAPASTNLLESLAERSGGNPLFAETIAQRMVEQGDTSEVELPDTVQGVLAARLDSLDPVEREVVAHASVIGRSFWEEAIEPIASRDGMELDSVLRGLRAKDIIVPGERVGRGDEPGLAFKHVLIRDVAYGMLPKAVRARKHAEVGAFIEQRRAEREGTAAVLAEHYGRAARLAVEAGFDDAELARLRGKASLFGEGAGDAAVALFSNVEALDYYQAAEALAADEPASRFRMREKRGDVALRLGRVDLAIECWQPCLAFWTDQDAAEHVAELHRKFGAALAHKGERADAIEHLQQGISLIKDRPASLALVRLYEEAAWLYMQAGDNMLAIYASEKALRLADQLGAIGAASRTHGIFGRIFGRIGDIGRARENLERAVELARQADAAEAALALLALGHHLEHFEGDLAAARSRYAEGLALAEQIGDVPAQIELQAALAQLAVYRGDWDEVRGASDRSAELAEREGLVGKLCLPDTLRGLLRWREGDFAASGRLFSEAHELAERIGWSEVSFSALLGLAAALRDQGDLHEAREALTRSLGICDRAGLTTQSIQALTALALVCVLADDPTGAGQAADQASALSEQAGNPVGQAAVLEARGLVEDLPDALGQAAQAWERLGRRLDAARCEQLLGRRLAGTDPSGAAEHLGRAAEAYDALGIRHLAEQARVPVRA